MVKSCYQDACVHVCTIPYHTRVVESDACANNILGSFTARDIYILMLNFILF